MIVDLKDVELQEPRKYLKKEGYFTLKCVSVAQAKTSQNGNPIYRLTFKNKDEEYIYEDLVITPNTKWKVKQIASAFGFDYDKVNILHFVNLFLVGGVKEEKVKNRHDQIVSVFRINSFAKSTKIQNEIPKEGDIPTEYTEYTVQDDYDYNVDEIPF